MRLLSALLGLLVAMAASGQSGPPAPRTDQADASLRADPVLVRALELEAGGDLRQAAEAYRGWLDSHSRVPTQGGTPEVLDRYAGAILHFAGTESDARLVQHFLSSAVTESMPPGARARILTALAELLESLGDVSGAQAACEQAYSLAPDPGAPQALELLLKSAALLYQQGGLEGAEPLARKVAEGARIAGAGELQAQALYLLGRVLSAAGRPDEAAVAWKLVVERAAGARSAPAACLSLWILATATGGEQEAAAALELLEGRYGSSPERELARYLSGQGGGVTPLAQPSDLLEPFGAFAVVVPAAVIPAPQEPASGAATTGSPESGGSPTAGTAAPEPGLFMVLAGSYTNRANAERHRDDIVAQGFAARIVQADVLSKRYDRVLVGEAGDYATVMGLIQKLKDANIESVPLQIGGGPSATPAE